MTHKTTKMKPMRSSRLETFPQILYILQAKKCHYNMQRMNGWVGLGEFADIINSRVFLKYKLSVTQYI